MRSGRPPTLWCDLIVTDGPPVNDDALDHVGIERALRQELGAADLLRLVLEHVDEHAADDLALGLRVGDAGERAEEALARRRRARAGCCSWSRNSVTTCSASPSAQQAVVDEDAGELVADRLVDQHRGDAPNRRRPRGRRSPGPLPTCARISAIASSRKARHRPVAGAAGDAAHEVARAAAAPSRRVHHLGVELHGVEAARLVGDGGERRVLRSRR